MDGGAWGDGAVSGGGGLGGGGVVKKNDTLSKKISQFFLKFHKYNNI